VTTPQADFAVVGAGLLGLATARALARRGREVTVLEQASPGHPGAGSRGSCRIFRLGYADPAYVQAARRSRELWHSLETETSRQILFPTPQLTIGSRLGAVREAMTAAGAPCELLAAAEAAARFPGIAAGGPALLEPESAVTAADTALEALASAVPEIRPGVRVSALADDGRRVTLQTSQGPLRARVAVVCAGPWTAGLLAGADQPRPGLHVPAAAALEQAAFLAPVAPPGPPMPIFLSHGGTPAPYGLPVPGSPLYKTGLHQSGPPVSPDQQDQGADPGLAARLAEVARRYLPGHDPSPAKVERCVYDNSPDEDFIVDRIGRVVVGCGTSGHGFKFGPLLGEWLAALASGEPVPGYLADLGARFRLARFSPPGAGT
jgi:sarcosine oxidase